MPLMRSLIPLMLVSTGSYAFGVESAETNASNRPVLTPTPSNAPVLEGVNRHVVDRTIPAYGVTSLRAERGHIEIEALAQDIASFAGDIQFRVLSGELVQPLLSGFTAVDDKEQKRREREGNPDPLAYIEAPQPINEITLLTGMREALETAVDGLLAPSHRERLLIDQAHANLDQAEAILFHGLAAEDIERIENQYKAWIIRMHIAEIKASQAKFAELQADNPKLDQRDFERMIEKGEVVITAEAPALPTNANALAEAQAELQSYSAVPAPATETSTVTQTETTIAETEEASETAAEEAPEEVAEAAAEEADTSAEDAMIDQLLNQGGDNNATDSIEIEIEIEEIPEE